MNERVLFSTACAALAPSLGSAFAQTVPLAATALDAESLKSNGVSAVTGLKNVIV